MPIGLFWYGWTAENKMHWIAPIIGTGFMGAGIIVTFVSFLNLPPSFDRLES